MIASCANAPISYSNAPISGANAPTPMMATKHDGSEPAAAKHDSDRAVDLLPVCIVCWENPADVAFAPCGHVTYCRACKPMADPSTCPYCRQPGQTMRLRYVYQIELDPSKRVSRSNLRDEDDRPLDSRSSQPPRCTDLVMVFSTLFTWTVTLLCVSEFH